MNTKRYLYETVKALLLDKTRLKHFMLFNSQFDEIDTENTFPFPCGFMEFTSLEWVTKSEGYQEAEVTFRLHIGIESLKTEELDILDLMEEVHKALQGFHDANCFTPLDRSFEGQDTNHDNVIVWLMDYDTLLSDNSGNRNNKLVKTTIGDLHIDRDDSTDSTAPRLKELRD